jgi:multicomponent Na+:H+ antiporter subunit E
VPTVIGATWLSFQLGSDQERSFRPLMLIRFIAFFLVRSVNSAVDVMMRVFDPRLPIDPALIEYPPSIEHDGGRILLANCITLLPGTISARLVQGVIIVHTLDKNLPIMASVAELEERVKTLYDPAPGEEGVQP